MKKEKEVEIAEEVVDLEAIQEIAVASQELVKELTEVVPPMNVAVPEVVAAEEEKKLISDEKLVGVFDEVLDNIRQDRAEIDDLLAQFKDMVLNGGDATTSSKEAVVNLAKIKLDTSDKMSKIVDLMARARGVNTYRPYMTTQNTQNNTVNIAEIPHKKNLTQEEKRALIESESKKQSKGII